jgi:glycosyltransferase involved in cell wall biosynthesis
MSSVDVIVPCYRYGRYLPQCVQSVLTQLGPTVRVLIIDDASPDDTSEIASDLARGDSRVTFWQHASNKGHIATYNEGIEWVSADYMLLLSADDYLLPGALGRAAKVLDAHPEVGFTFGEALRIDDSSVTAQPSNPEDTNSVQILSGMQFIRLCAASNIVPSPTAVVRAGLQKRIGGYRPELPHSGDMEMWLRFGSQAAVAKIGAYQAVYRRHSQNMSLSYMENAWLRDLEQRKAALTCFFEFCADKLPDCEQLRRKLLRSLACTALGCANHALGRDEVKSCDQLMQFATSVYPQAKRSLRWMRLSLKRTVLYGSAFAIRQARTGKAESSEN